MTIAGPLLQRFEQLSEHYLSPAEEQSRISCVADYILKEFNDFQLEPIVARFIAEQAVNSKWPNGEAEIQRLVRAAKSGRVGKGKPIEIPRAYFIGAARNELEKNGVTWPFGEAKKAAGTHQK